MTLFGKILVLLNVALSLLLCAWAVGVYTRHIEYSADLSKSAPETVMEVRRLQSRLVSYGLWDELSASEAHWKKSSPRLQLAEAIRPRNQKWFEAKLVDLGKSTDPIKKPGYENAQCKVTTTEADYGLPVMVDALDKAGQPLKGLDPYQKEYADKQVAIKASMDELTRFTKEDAELTVRIGGVGGLRDQIAAEIDKRERVLVEQEFLKPMLVNSRVEGELLFRRRAELESRVKELQGVGVAASP
jgi:hypothetical protein